MHVRSDDQVVRRGLQPMPTRVHDRVKLQVVRPQLRDVRRCVQAEVQSGPRSELQWPRPKCDGHSGQLPVRLFEQVDRKHVHDLRPALQRDGQQLRWLPGRLRGLPELLQEVHLVELLGQRPCIDGHGQLENRLQLHLPQPLDGPQLRHLPHSVPTVHLRRLRRRLHGRGVPDVHAAVQQRHRLQRTSCRRHWCGARLHVHMPQQLHGRNLLQLPIHLRRDQGLRRVCIRLRGLPQLLLVLHEDGQLFW